MRGGSLPVKRNFGDGALWNISPNETAVIPAKAGIQSVDRPFPKVCGADSRFRGNDCGLKRPCLANDATTNPVQTIAFSGGQV
jgi:hypothetical protein